MLPTDNDISALDPVKGFYFKMSYKYLRQRDAVVRYGPPSSPKFIGMRDQSTVCDVFFNNCDTTPCYVQSPNFPGMYPRNTTCYYTISQKEIPKGKRAIISLNQENAHLIHVKSAKKHTDTEQRVLKIHEDCYYIGDYVRVYDGNSTTSPILVTFCRGDVLPSIVSSGPYMLIEFTTSPFDSLHHEVPWTHLNGFELIAKTRFFEDNHMGPNCHTKISALQSRSGWVVAPRYSLPTNSTCVWEFLGRPTDFVWLIFGSYVRTTQIKLTHTSLCASKLTITNGSWGSSSKELGSYCRNSKPVLCERAHKLFDGSVISPCSGKNESYISSGPNATISQLYSEASIVTKSNFLLRYEFVDKRQAGYFVKSPCDRFINSTGTNEKFNLTGPRNVFLYGRGGRKNIQCSWTLQGHDDEAVKMTITSLTTTGQGCTTAVSKYKEFQCKTENTPYMTLSISEFPWNGVELPRACLCSSKVPLTIETKSSKVVIKLNIVGMNPNHDFSNFYFNIEYEFFKQPLCEGGSRQFDAPAGEILLEGSEDSGACAKKPYLLIAPGNLSLLLTIPGAGLANQSCSLNSRLYLRLPGAQDPLAEICPSPEPKSNLQMIWPDSNIRQNHSKSSIYSEPDNSKESKLIMHWDPESSSTLSVRWLRIFYLENSVFKSRSNSVEALRKENGSYPFRHEPQSYDIPCKEHCPELNACIASEVWCDGEQHCPQGN